MLQARVDLNAQKASQLEQQTLIVQLKDQLNQVMNIRNPAGYDVYDTIPLNMALNIRDLQAGIERTNPLLQISRKNIDIAGLTLKERKAERFPIVSFNSAYNFSRTCNNDF